ncbi:MAG: P44/Msp2 family outer membrane protein, partial [Anaplasma sp.]
MARVKYCMVMGAALCLFSTAVQGFSAPRVPRFYASLAYGPTVGNVSKFRLDDHGGEVKWVVPYVGRNGAELISENFDWFEMQDTPVMQWKNYGFTGLKAALGHNIRSGVRVEVEFAHEQYSTLGRNLDRKITAGGSKYFALVGGTAAVVQDPIAFEGALRGDGSLSKIETLVQLRKYLREHVERGEHVQQGNEEYAVRHASREVAATVAAKLGELIEEKGRAASLAKMPQLNQMVRSRPLLSLGAYFGGLSLSTVST